MWYVPHMHDKVVLLASNNVTVPLGLEKRWMSVMRRKPSSAATTTDHEPWAGIIHSWCKQQLRASFLKRYFKPLNVTEFVYTQSDWINSLSFTLLVFLAGIINSRFSSVLIVKKIAWFSFDAQNSLLLFNTTIESCCINGRSHQQIMKSISMCVYSYHKWCPM